MHPKANGSPLLGEIGLVPFSTLLEPVLTVISYSSAAHKLSKAARFRRTSSSTPPFEHQSEADAISAKRTQAECGAVNVREGFGMTE